MLSSSVIILIQYVNSSWSLILVIPLGTLLYVSRQS